MRKMIESAKDMTDLAIETGILPYFRNEIPGFSIEEHTPSQLWFSDEEGPWEWKGSAASSGKLMYGKLFRNKAGFCSLEFLPDLINMRRRGMDFDERYFAGMTPREDRLIYNTIVERREISTRYLKALTGYAGKDGKRGFDTIMTRLQMQTYIAIGDFEYARDRFGREYGWGMARYTTPEELFGEDVVVSRYGVSAEESMRAIAEAVAKRIGVGAGDLERVLR